jgi:hypothetical protein
LAGFRRASGRSFAGRRFPFGGVLGLRDLAMLVAARDIARDAPRD